ncbi:DUF72 domain-containing protein [Candidatus Nitrospira bockiana]
MDKIHIGLSGYSYKPWQGPGRFYPPGLKPAEFLRYYAEHYDTVELDGIWYRLPTEKTVLSWIDQTPDTFLFSPKAHRQITHLHRLRPDALAYVRLMLDRLAPLIERRRLGSILLQLPPNLLRDTPRLQAFLEGLPATVRWAMEFRHPSWHTPEVEALLKRHGVAWAAVETDDGAPECRATADFWYVRLRRSQYDEAGLEQWAQRLKEAAGRGATCFLYFKHEDEGSPWIWADRLARLIGQ